MQDARQIAAQIQSLESDLRDALKEEYSRIARNRALQGDTKEETLEVLRRYAMQELRSNRAIWSGGNCAVNLIEQSRRDVAVQMLDKFERNEIP